jgi:membrane fusion protein (multidrug efflux system)
VSERQVQPGDYVNIGTNLISVVPLPNAYVIANYKETQLTYVKPGQPVEITVDSFSKESRRLKPCSHFVTPLRRRESSGPGEDDAADL